MKNLMFLVKHEMTQLARLLIRLHGSWDSRYPGGPHIDALAAEGNPEAIEFPKALSEPGNFEFSF